MACSLRGGVDVNSPRVGDHATPLHAAVARVCNQRHNMMYTGAEIKAKYGTAPQAFCFKSAERERKRARARVRKSVRARERERASEREREGGGERGGEGGREREMGY